MRINALSSASTFFAQNPALAFASPAPEKAVAMPKSVESSTSSAPAEIGPKAATSGTAAPAAERTAAVDRAMIRASAVAIVGMLDLTCVLWVYPIADRLLEYAGAAPLKAVHLGLDLMFASIPVVLAITVVAWRKIAKRWKAAANASKGD
jgi:hypothetical protein